METSQCVPSWDVDDPPSHPSSNLSLHHYHPSDEPIHPPDLRKDYEVAELTWENGQLALHGLVPPRIGKANYTPPSGVVDAAAAAAAATATAWNKHHHRSGTLEAVVNQATSAALPGGGPDIEEWFLRGGRSATAVAAAVDALVPCQDDATNRVPKPVEAGRPNRPRMVGVCSSQGSAVGSLAGARVESTTLVTLGTCREDGDVALTATATTATNSASPETESTSLGKRKALALDDYVSVSHTSSHNKHDSLYDDEEKASKIEAEKASASTKKRRAAAIHNQSERKRRDRINQRMKTLQKLVPNSSKTDKASMLDEVIEYLKQLQAQIQMMSRMNNMMMPMAVMPGQIPVPMMAAHLAHMAQLRQPQPQLLPQMGVGVPGMVDLASIRRSMPPSLPMLHPSAFLALPTVAAGVWDGSAANRPVGNAVLADPYSTLLACQMAQQPMSLDEYSRMAALFEQLYQQQQQPPPPPPSNGKSS